MKAKDLIKILQENLEGEVFVSSDEEGNSYHSINAKTIDVNLNSFVLYPFDNADMRVNAEQQKTLEYITTHK